MSFFSGLSRQEKATFFSAFGGWVVDAFDYMIFTFVMATLMSLWNISAESAGFLSTVTLLSSSAGGWGAGLLADRIGRVRMLQIAILWFSVCTVLIGFSQNFTQLFVLRLLQGVGFGGEWAVGSVLVGEMVRPEYRGKAVGIVQSGWAVGWGLAALVFVGSFSLFPEEIAWRVLFWIGVLPALLVLYIRRSVPEPEAFLKAHEAGVARGTIREIFSPALLRTTVLTSLLCLGIQGGYYAITTWLPVWLQRTQGLSVGKTGGYLSVVILGSFVGYLSGAVLADRWGRRATFAFFALLSLVSVIGYMEMTLAGPVMLLAGFALGFSASGIYSGLGAYLTELFPAVVRANGQGFAYNSGRALGALFPGLIGFLSHRLTLGTAICLFAACAYGLVLIVLLFLPETRGKVLES